MNQDLVTSRSRFFPKSLGPALTSFERISVVILVILLPTIVFMGMLFRYLPFGTGLLTLATEELGNLCLVWLWLWAGAAVHRMDTHFRLSVVVDRLGKRTVFALNLVNNVILLLLMVALVKYNLQQFMLNLGIKTMGMEWPVTLFVFPLLLGCPLIALHTLIRLVSLIRGGVPAR